MLWKMIDVKRSEAGRGLLLFFVRNGVGRVVQLEKDAEIEKWARRLRCIEKWDFGTLFNFPSRIGERFRLNFEEKKPS